MTDREKLIELLFEAWRKAEEACAFVICAECEGRKVGSTHCMTSLAVDYLLANGVTFATDTNVGSKWISVEDRLPEGGKAIICLGIRGDIFIGKWMDILRKGDNVAHCHVIVGKHTAGYKCATHWMPLPEPPKEG